MYLVKYKYVYVYVLFKYNYKWSKSDFDNYDSLFYTYLCLLIYYSNIFLVNNSNQKI